MAARQVSIVDRVDILAYSVDSRTQGGPRIVETRRRTAAYCGTCLSESWEGWSTLAVSVSLRPSLRSAYICIKLDQQVLPVPLETRDPNLQKRLLRRRLGPLDYSSWRVRVSFSGSVKNARQRCIIVVFLLSVIPFVMQIL